MHIHVGGYNETYPVQSWFNEYTSYSYVSNSCASGAVCGHYTQVKTIDTMWMDLKQLKLTRLVYMCNSFSLI